MKIVIFSKIAENKRVFDDFWVFLWVFCVFLEFFLFYNYNILDFFLNFFFLKEKVAKRSKKPAVLSLIDFGNSLSRSPIGYLPPQRTRL